MGSRLRHVSITVWAAALACALAGWWDAHLGLRHLGVVLGLLAGCGAALGVVLGILLAAAAGQGELVEAREELWAFLRLDTRSNETQKLAWLLSRAVFLSVWLAAGWVVVKQLVERLANPSLEALAVCLALLVLGAVCVAGWVMLEDALVVVLGLRRRLVQDQLGLVSVQAVVLLAAVAMVVAAVGSRTWLANLLYALDARAAVPFALGVVGAALLLLLLSAEVAEPLVILLTGVPASLLVLLLSTGGAWRAMETLQQDATVREAVFEASPAITWVASMALDVEELEDVPVVEEAPIADAGQPPVAEAVLDAGAPLDSVDAGPGIPAPRPHVVVISVDTLRADHVGAWGYTRHPTTPNLDAWAAKGTRFSRTYAAGPCSSASFIGMMTSRIHARIPGLKLDGDVFALPSQAVTLASRFRKAGYATHAFIPVIQDYLKGVEMGFETFDRDFHYAEALANDAVDAVGRLKPDQPTFLWVHFVDPHFPYDAHSEFSAWGRAPRDVYDQEIAFSDKHIGRILQALPPNTLVAIVADHGEAFGDHGTRLHGNSLHEEEVRVPFILVGPGVPVQVVESPVSLMDLGPTLAAAAGVAWDGARLDGQALTASLRGDMEPARRVVVEGCRPGTMVALVDAEKLYYRHKSALFFLFDLVADPGERKNLFHQAKDAGELASQARRELGRSR